MEPQKSRSARVSEGRPSRAAVSRVVHLIQAASWLCQGRIGRSQIVADPAVGSAARVGVLGGSSAAGHSWYDATNSSSAGLRF